MLPGKGVSLVRFGCVSRPRGDMPEAALRRFARAASERNRAMGLTGELRFGAGEFRQVIEGPCEAIMLIASEIIADERHESLEVTGFLPIGARDFAGWDVFGLDDSPAYCQLSSAAAVSSPAVYEGGWMDVAADGRA